MNPLRSLINRLGYELVRSDAAFERDDLALIRRVQPFTMTSPLFRAIGPAFPQYTSWGRETVLLNTAWLTVGISGLLAAWWAAFVPRGLRSVISRWAA